MAEETILTGDDLMIGPPSPIIPPEMAVQVMADVDLCSSGIRSLFECLQTNVVEPFCQDEILKFRRCCNQRDVLLRQRLLEVEESMCEALSLEQAADRKAELEGSIGQLERRMALANMMEGGAGFQQRWRLYGEQQDTRARLEVVDRHFQNLEAMQKPSKRKTFVFF